jgi:transcriptional regulator with XRE-family HTH domain
LKTNQEMSALLEDARIKKGLSYLDLGRLCGLSPLGVRQAIQGKSAPRITTLFALLHALDLALLVVPEQSLPMLRNVLESDRDGQGDSSRVLTLVEQANQP